MANRNVIIVAWSKLRYVDREGYAEPQRCQEGQHLRLEQPAANGG